MSASADIRARLRELGRTFTANENIAEVMREGDAQALEVEVAQVVDSLLAALVIQIDHNTECTPERVARMLMGELYRGRYEPAPEVTDFPNVRKLDELYAVGPLAVRSTCAHHLVPVIGQAWIGVIPGDRLIGLSKFSRVVDWVMSRPQMQEEAVVQLADLLERLLAPKGLGVVLRASHLCMTLRGVRETASTMTTSVMRGLLLTNPAAREEFLALTRGQGA